MRGVSRINKTWRLFHVDLLVKNTVKEGIMDIKLMNFPTTRNDNGEDQSDGRLFDDRTKGFRVINTFLLSETPSNQTCFIPLDATIRSVFNLVHPPTTNNIHGGVKWY